jgi:hypothetical protein
MPLSMTNIFDYCHQKPDIRSLADSLYYFLYCVNFIIYAIWQPDFRVAYVSFLGRLV